MTGQIILNTITDMTITSRPCAVSLSDGASLTVDMIDPTTTFQIGASVTGGTVTPTGDVNPAGTGPAGEPFPFSVTPAGTLPAASVVQNVIVTP